MVSTTFTLTGALRFRASDLQIGLQSDFEVLDDPVKDVFVDT